jgi:hypothetical protein
LHDDGTANIYRAGVDTFRVDALPAELDISIVLRLLMPEDRGGSVEVYMLGPDTRPLGNLDFAIMPSPGSGHRPGYMVSQIEALHLLFLAETEGVYSVELYVDHDPRHPLSDEHRRTLFFNVRAGLPDD